ncbi:MAG: thioredoxin [Acidimicrobiales bacterium]
MAKTTEIVCPSCQARNRVPIAAAGKPRCGKCKANLPWLVDVGTVDFDEIVASSAVPVLVDLWAPWCGPCKAVAPALEHLAGQRAGALRVIKINVDNEPTISARLGVQGIPTMVLYNDGAEVARQVGALPAHRISAWIDTSLASTA